MRHDMKATRKPNSHVFGKIKQALDPAYGYLVFQKATAARNKNEFYAIFNVIDRLQLDILEWKIHYDQAESIALLVVKVNPGRTNKLLEEFVNEGVPKDIIFYSFGSRVGVRGKVKKNDN